jgi:hypothetical protein
VLGVRGCIARPRLSALRFRTNYCLRFAGPGRDGFRMGSLKDGLRVEG